MLADLITIQNDRNGLTESHKKYIKQIRRQFRRKESKNEEFIFTKMENQFVDDNFF